MAETTETTPLVATPTPAQPTVPTGLSGQLLHQFGGLGSFQQVQQARRPAVPQTSTRSNPLKAILIAQVCSALCASTVHGIMLSLFLLLPTSSCPNVREFGVVMYSVMIAYVWITPTVTAIATMWGATTFSPVVFAAITASIAFPTSAFNFFWVVSHFFPINDQRLKGIDSTTCSPFLFYLSWLLGVMAFVGVAVWVILCCTGGSLVAKAAEMQLRRQAETTAESDNV
eukprot:GDKH01016582.1.p1 GENE.GDKH01016582.1~~GDKH01016582.1.p1  ORF type:complete len:228 (-),score=2.27 GDKH01016582.1:389-1072(-)